MKERELPLVALRAFAVAARTDSLSSAAEQLGVTHGAVSKQVRSLEDWLGQQVFTREGRGLVLTPYGKILAEQLSRSFRDIDAACQYVRRHRSKSVLAVEAPSTFAMYFLMPRLKRFENRYPDLAVWISTRMTGQTPEVSSNDLLITRGSADRVGSHLKGSTALFEESLTPVCRRKIVAEASGEEADGHSQASVDHVGYASGKLGGLATRGRHPRLFLRRRSPLRPHVRGDARGARRSWLHCRP